MKKTIKLLAIACVIAMLCTALLSSCTQSSKTAMTCKDYEVDSGMMSYFLNETYNNYINQTYQTYYTYYSYGLTYDDFSTWMNNNLGLDMSLPLEEQEYSLSDDGKFATWEDYFVNTTVESVKQLLIYCAEAEKLDIVLNSEDTEDINTTIDTLYKNLRASYPEDMSDKELLEAAYGKGVTEDDVRKALELQAFANKTAQKIGDDIEKNIPLPLIESAYSANRINYDRVDYLTYYFDVSYMTVFEELFAEELNLKIETLSTDDKARLNAKYQEQIEEARKKAAALAQVKTSDEFLSWVLTNELYDDEFTSATSKLTDWQKPSSYEDLAFIKTEMIASIVKDINADKLDENVFTIINDNGVESYSVYGKTVSKEFAEAAKKLKSNLYNSANDLIVKGDSYIAPTGDDDEKGIDELSEWAFADNRKVGDVTTIEDGDCANGASLSTYNMIERFTVDVCLLTKTAYRDETASYNISYMIFDDKSYAKAAIDALTANGTTVSSLKVLEISQRKDTNHIGYDEIGSYFLEDMHCEEFDNWLTTAELYTVTPNPIEADTNYFIVAYNGGAGELNAWQYEVKSDLYEKDYTAYEEKMIEKYSSSIVIDDACLNDIHFGPEKKNFFEKLIDKIFGKDQQKQTISNIDRVGNWGITIDTEESTSKLYPSGENENGGVVAVRPSEGCDKIIITKPADSLVPSYNSEDESDTGMSKIEAYYNGSITSLYPSSGSEVIYSITITPANTVPLTPSNGSDIGVVRPEMK